MPSYREMKSIAENPSRIRTLARSLLTNYGEWSDWELDFLESMSEFYGPDALSMRQREKLVELRDGAVWITETPIGGFSVRILLKECNEMRHDLDDDEDIEFLETHEGQNSIKKRHAAWLMRISRQLGVLEPDWD